ncbi:MAG: hypothetical protein ACLSAP_12620, partial [Oscillospiraceae bacterium]
ARPAAQSENIYESFLGMDHDFTFLNDSYYGGNVNLWSGNFVMRYTLPYGNLYSRFPLTLTYNSQADCDIGLGRNVVMNYWAELELIDANTVKLMNGTGTIDTFTKNPATGRFENDGWYVEADSQGGYHAVARGGTYYFDAMGKVTNLQVGNADVLVIYNSMDYIERMEAGSLAYQFYYEPTGPDTLRCVGIESNYPFALEYDEQGHLIGGGYAYEPYERDFTLSYTENGLMSGFSMYGEDTVPVQYQTIDGYPKVTNYNGTQIVYGKNQTIAIDPNGIVTSWQFDGDGNLIAKT